MKKAIIALSIIGLIGISVPQKAHAGLFSHILVGVIAHNMGESSGQAQQQATDATTISSLNATIAALNTTIASLQDQLKSCQAKPIIKKKVK